MTEWKMTNILKSYQRMIERDNAEHPQAVLNDILYSVRHVLGELPKSCTDVVEVVTDGDYLIRFADGVEYAVLEGVVPIKVDSHFPTSDIMFVMDTTTDEWKLVDWVLGINLMSTNDIVEYCKELRKKGAD